MTPKPKLLIDGKIFHLIEEVTYGGLPIFASGNDRIVLNQAGKVIHRNERIEEDEKFLRQFHRKGGDLRRRKRSSNLSNFNRADLLRERGRVKTRPLEKEG